MKKINLKHVWSVSPDTFRKLPFFDRLRLQPIKENHPDWYKKASREIDGKSDFTLKMCPSTTNFLNKGFVVQNPTDIWVIRNDSGEVKIETSIENNEHIQIHGTDQFGNDYPFEEGFMNISFKFKSYWQVQPDKPTSVMFLPCWWHPCHNYIRAYHGLIDWKKTERVNFYSINTKIRLPEAGQSFKILAGVPIAQLLFVDVNEVFIQDDLPDFYSTSEHELYDQATARHSKKYMEFLKSYICGGKRD